MDALRPVDGLPPHMRKPKPSIQPEESSGTSEYQNTVPGGISHAAALSKPKQQARAKKTIMFEDDDEEEDTTAKTFTFTSKEPVQQEKTYTEEPKIQEHEVQRTSTNYYLQQPAHEEEVPVQRASNVQKKKVAFDDGVQDAPADPNTFGSDNPLALLKGLKELNENKSSPKKAERASVKRNEQLDDDEEEAPKQTNQRTSMGADNPLALLSGLKEMDASKGRKSKAGRKTKGIFEDDEDGNDDFLAPKKNETKTTAAKPRESNRLTKLFDDSDEEKNDWGRKSGSPVKTQTQSKGKPRLFDDDD